MARVGLWPCDPGTRVQASRDLPCELVIQERNLAPLREKLLIELVTSGSGPFVALEGEKVGVGQ